MGIMMSYNKNHVCAQLYVTILIPHLEFELCTICYEYPESILCIYVRNTGGPEIQAELSHEAEEIKTLHSNKTMLKR